MKTLKNWTLDKQSATHLELVVDEQHRLCLYVLEENLFRVLIKRKGELALTEPGASRLKKTYRGKVGTATTSAVSVARAGRFHSRTMV